MKDLQIKLAQDIQAYSISQVELWRRVPYLALMCDGLTGWSGGYSTAYSMGLWRLGSCIQHGGYTITVDLESGNLTLYDKPINFDMYSHIIRLICQIDAKNLDAKVLVNWLEFQSNEKPKSYTNIDDIIENHQKYSHIEPRYIRQGKIPKPYYGWD